MRVPRLRIKLWVLIVAIAAVAVLITVMMRPHPVASIFTLVKWSDGSRMMTGPAPTRYRPFGPLLAVDWDDGSSSWYLSRNLLRHGNLGDGAANWIATLKNDPNAATREEAASQITDYAENIDQNAAVPVLIAAMKDRGLPGAVPCRRGRPALRDEGHVGAPSDCGGDRRRRGSRTYRGRPCIGRRSQD